ncbi:MAG: hypothetical protein ACN4GW_06210 [Desulforhopalus sp.]
MSTIKNEAELTRVINGLIEDGNSGHLREISQLMQKRICWKNKKSSLLKIITKYQGTHSNDTRTA